LLDRFLSFPSEYRLPFREFGMAIGLHAVERIEGLMGEKPNVFSKNHPVCSQIKYLRRFLPLGEPIEKIWLDPQNRRAETWTEASGYQQRDVGNQLSPGRLFEIVG